MCCGMAGHGGKTAAATMVLRKMTTSATARGGDGAWATGLNGGS